MVCFLWRSLFCELRGGGGLLFVLGDWRPGLSVADSNEYEAGFLMRWPDRDPVMAFQPAGLGIFSPEQDNTVTRATSPMGDTTPAIRSAFHMRVAGVNASCMDVPEPMLGMLLGLPCEPGGGLCTVVGGTTLHCPRNTVCRELAGGGAA